MTPNAPLRMPVLFVGHGSPMNAIEDNVWSRGFRELGVLTQRARAILAVSAHWFVPGTFVTGDPRPKTIHDFGGFPDELYEIQYPARGDVDLARRVVELIRDASLDNEPVQPSTEWGLDHGTWSVLRHMRPGADVPVVQLSIDARAPFERHVAIGRALAPLRDEGVLLLASGNIVHNLRDAFQRMRTGDTATPDWATRFDAHAARALEEHDTDFLIHALESDIGRMSHPTPDHYIPLLHAAGAADARDEARFPIVGFDLGSLSMRSVVFGAGA